MMPQPTEKEIIRRAYELWQRKRAVLKTGDSRHGMERAMGLFKSFFPGLAGNLEARLGDQYAPPVGAFWPFSDPEQVALDKARYDAGFKPLSTSFDDQGECENIKH